MSTTTSLSLIEGEFDSEEATEVLMNIFSTKIHFHVMRNFSSEERFGKPDEVSTTRIPVLKNNIALLTEILSEAKRKGLNLNISANIQISVG
jgi:hypothetical protein